MYHSQQLGTYSFKYLVKSNLGGQAIFKEERETRKRTYSRFPWTKLFYFKRKEDALKIISCCSFVYSRSIVALILASHMAHKDSSRRYFKFWVYMVLSVKNNLERHFQNGMKDCGS